MDLTPKSPTTIEDQLIVLHPRGGPSRYEIARNRIPSKSALLQWIRHLIGNGWMDTESLAEFIDKTAKAQNISIWET